MNTKPEHKRRNIMVSVMITADMDRWLRNQAAAQRVTLSTVSYTLLAEAMEEKEVVAASAE